MLLSLWFGEYYLLSNNTLSDHQTSQTSKFDMIFSVEMIESKFRFQSANLHGDNLGRKLRPERKTSHGRCF